MYVIVAHYPEAHGGEGTPWGEVLGYTLDQLKASEFLVEKAIAIADGWREHRGLQRVLVKTISNTAFRDGLETFEVLYTLPDEAIVTGKIDGERVHIRLCVEPVEEIEI